MQVKDIMTANPSWCSPSDSLQEVARSMRENDCGALPVVENGRVMGIITDRDLAVRGLAEGKSARSLVSEIVTPDPRCCAADDDVREVERIMSDAQVRRVPVVDAAGKCVGIVSQADIARAAKDGGQVSDKEIAIMVERISEPQRPSVERGPTPSAEYGL